MSTFKLSIKTGNAAFEDNALLEIARILRDAADRIEWGHDEGRCVDMNGNTVGFYSLSEVD